MNYELEIINITKEYNGKLPQSDIDSIVVLASHREWGVALENLCTQIYEYELKVSKQSFFKIKEMITKMKLDTRYLDDLSELVE
jgi:hypothetical protein